MYEHNALGYWSGLALCLTKVRSSRARCPATALIIYILQCILTYRKQKQMSYKPKRFYSMQNNVPEFVKQIRVPFSGATLVKSLPRLSH